MCVQYPYLYISYSLYFPLTYITRVRAPGGEVVGVGDHFCEGVELHPVGKVLAQVAVAEDHDVPRQVAVLQPGTKAGRGYCRWAVWKWFVVLIYRFRRYEKV